MASDDKPSNAASPDPAAAASEGKEEEMTTTTEKDVLLRLPDARLHLVDRSRSHPLAAGDLSLVRVRARSGGCGGGASLAAVALVLPPEQWPLARDVVAVKLDATHYSFTLVAAPGGDDPDAKPLHYGLTLSCPDPRLDGFLDAYTTFSTAAGGGEAPANAAHGDGEGEAAAYWTAVAPNVEDYGAAVARAITAGAGHLADGILWCGEVTAERLWWGRHVIQNRIQPGDADAAVSPEMLSRIRRQIVSDRAKKLTENTETVANGILSGVVQFTGYFSSAVTNSKAAKKVFNLVPGEIALASLEGYGKICDAIEVAGKNVLSTSSAVTTELISYKYGGKAAAATNEGLGAAGHAARAVWAVFKIRQAWNPKSILKPRAIFKSTAKSMFNSSRAKSRL
ncbi:hypothetical protein EJB05_13520, partial [Eragrostis curvula]